jgi:uncharacterized damage-inducible protein DinB
VSRAAVLQLESLLNRSFDGENTQSLLFNLGNLAPDDWDWIPRGGERSIRAIFEHAAIAKHIYVDFLFGGANRRWTDVEAECHSQAGDDADALIAWARAGHAAFMAGMATLRDDDLQETTTKWHGARDTKAEVIAVMIQHDCYHAGEINHLRAVHQQRDGVWS